MLGVTPIEEEEVLMFVNGAEKSNQGEIANNDVNLDTNIEDEEDDELYSV